MSGSMVRLRLFVFSIILIASWLGACNPRNEVKNTNSTSSSSNATDKKSQPQSGQSQNCVNLNSASAKELMTLPGIGEATAKRIIEYREKYGPFRRPEEMIIIEGFGERKYRALADLVCV